MHVSRQNVDFRSLFDNIFSGAFFTMLFLLPTHGRTHILEGICTHKVLISRPSWFVLHVLLYSTQAKNWPEDRIVRKCGQGFLTWVNSSVDIQWVSHSAARGNRRNQHTQQQQYSSLLVTDNCQEGAKPHILLHMYSIYSSWDSDPFRNLSQCQSEGCWYLEMFLMFDVVYTEDHMSKAELFTCGLLLVCCCHQQFYVTRILRVLVIKFLKFLKLCIVRHLPESNSGCMPLSSAVPWGLQQKGHHPFEVQVHKLWNFSNFVYGSIQKTNFKNFHTAKTVTNIKVLP